MVEAARLEKVGGGFHIPPNITALPLKAKPFGLLDLSFSYYRGILKQRGHFKAPSISFRVSSNRVRAEYR